MRRTMLIMRLFATLGLALWLVDSVSFQATAQGNETGNEETVEEGSGNGTGNTTGESTEEPAETQEETQEEEPAEEPVDEPPPTGTLSVLVYSCTTGGDAGTGAVFPDGGFSPDDSCTEGTATITIDGGEATDVTASAEFTLDAGTHPVADTTTGAALDVDVVADAVTTISVVAYAEPEEEAVLAEAPEAEEVPKSNLLIVTHDCAAQIQTADALTALTASDKLRLCPVVTLPADPETDPTAFDYAFGDDNPDTIIGLDPTAGEVCESELGEDSDADPSTDPCFDTSGYTVTVKGAETTITETALPLNRTLGAVEVEAPEALTSFDPAASQIVLDTSSEEDVTVHVYHFSPGVNVVVHLCPESVKTTNSFNAKLKKCPAATLDGGDAPVNAVNETAPAFDVTVADAETTQDITGASYLPNLACESGLQVEIDGDDATDLCLAGYAYRGVAPGDVTITQTPPEGYTIGTAEVAPASADPAPDVRDGIVTIDTAEDGDVTVHLFNFVVPDDGGGNDPGGNTGGGDDDDDGGNTPGGNTGGEDDDDDEGENTGGGGNNTGGDGSGNGQDGENSNGFGAIEIYNLYCLADSEYVAIEVLEPGQNVDPYSFGDDTCLQDGNEFQITEHGRNDLPPFDVGFDGYEYVDGLPSTEGDDSHLITETWTGTTVPFEVENGAVTEIVVLVFEYDDYEDDEYYEDAVDEYAEYADDEQAVEDGDGLPETGAPMTTPGSHRDLLLLLGLTGVLALGCGYRLRRTASM
jgi:hypothetical protein